MSFQQRFIICSLSTLVHLQTSAWLCNPQVQVSSILPCSRESLNVVIVGRNAWLPFCSDSVNNSPDQALQLISIPNGIYEGSFQSYAFNSKSTKQDQKIKTYVCMHECVGKKYFKLIDKILIDLFYTGVTD